MNTALTLQTTPVDSSTIKGTEPSGRANSRAEASSGADRATQRAPAAADPIAWPVLWARCWSRIRTWPVPPRWSYRDWCDEAHAQGVAAGFAALRDFDPRRLVPLDAFLYGRMVDAVRTRYRQEWAYGRHTRPGAAILNRPAPERAGPEPELEADNDTLIRLQAALGHLGEPDLGLIRQLFWDGRRGSDLARDRGVSHQSISKRKKKILLGLRRQWEGCEESAGRIPKKDERSSCEFDEGCIPHHGSSV